MPHQGVRSASTLTGSDATAHAKETAVSLTERCGVNRHTVTAHVAIIEKDLVGSRRAFDGLHMLGLDIKYSVNNTAAGKAQTSRELVITNWEPGTQNGGLF